MPYVLIKYLRAKSYSLHPHAKQTGANRERMFQEGLKVVPDFWNVMKDECENARRTRLKPTTGGDRMR